MFLRLLNDPGIFWQKSLRHFKLYMIHQLYAKRQQVLSIGYQESLVIRVKNLHKKRKFKKCFHPLVIYTTILLKQQNVLLSHSHAGGGWL